MMMKLLIIYHYGIYVIKVPDSDDGSNTGELEQNYNYKEDEIKGIFMSLMHFSYFILISKKVIGIIYSFLL